mmetsp:Transcript_44622/g.71723  ORF Transcript_44622/g.71723 Transcript_44622/m.71723 type:complete len:93 (+) Transcript_44622:1593-1871(+)
MSKQARLEQKDSRHCIHLTKHWSVVWIGQMGYKSREICLTVSSETNARGLNFASNESSEGSDSDSGSEREDMSLHTSSLAIGTGAFIPGSLG